MVTQVRQQFGSKVRRLRERRGISLRQFALSVNLDKTFLSDIERGNRSATLDTIDKIARGLDVSLSELFLGVGDNEGTTGMNVDNPRV